MPSTTNNDYLIHFSGRDLSLIVDALEFYSRQTMMFGSRADEAATMATELEETRERQDAV